MGFDGFRPTRIEKSDSDIPTIRELERIAKELEERNESITQPSQNSLEAVEGELPEAAALELRRVVEEVRKTE